MYIVIKKFCGRSKNYKGVCLTLFCRLPGASISGNTVGDNIAQSTEVSDYQQTSISLLRAQLKVRYAATIHCAQRQFVNIYIKI